MVKVRVFCSNPEIEPVIEELYEFGAIHVSRSKLFKPGSPLQKLEGISPMLVKIRAVEDSLKHLAKKAAGKPKDLRSVDDF